MQDAFEISSSSSSSSLSSSVSVDDHRGEESLTTIVGSGLASYGLLTEQELSWACLSEDIDLRLVSLNLITASLRTSVPLPRHEFLILKRSLQYSLKSTHVDHRHRIVRSIKSLLIRVTEIERAASRDLVKLAQRAEKLKSNLVKLDRRDEANSENAAELIVKLEENSMLINEANAAIESSYEVYKWLSAEILNNLYPGTTSDREMMALDIFNCVMETVEGYLIKPEFVACFFSETMTNTIINLLISGWDRSRRMAADLILKFPKPIPFHTTVSSVNTLLIWGCNLTGSARQRESEAGALILRDLFYIYCLHLKWSDITIPQTAFDCGGEDESLERNFEGGVPSTVGLDKPHDGASEVKVESINIGNDASVICSTFLHRACDLFEVRLKSLEKLLKCMDNIEGSNIKKGSDSSSPSLSDSTSLHQKNDPLCHGLLMALRLCLQVVRSEGLLLEPVLSSHLQPPSQAQTKEVWQPLVQRLQQLSMSSLHAAMKVVAEAPSDSRFAPLPRNAIRLLNARNGGSNGNGTVSPFVIRSLLEGSAFDSIPNENTVHLAESGGKGPVNASNAANMSMAASYVNTNSIMGGGTDGDAIDEKGAEAQRAVVAAWLLVKESAAMLSFLVEISPPPQVPSIDSSLQKEQEHEGKKSELAYQQKSIKHIGVARTVSIPLLSVSEISGIGWTMLDALGRLKHMGAIAETHSALQTISEVLLRHADRSSDLCRLPGQWLLAILGRLECEQQVSILRRSAGFAYSFLSILRAEPANCKPILLHIAMQSLLLYAENGLTSSSNSNSSSSTQSSDFHDHKDVDNVDGEDGIVKGHVSDVENIQEAASVTSSQIFSSSHLHISWRICVHALNVLRLIITDAALGNDVDFYIARAAKVAVSGFRSPKWAVRNSSMMLFTAVVQRSIDNDKNESGGAKASTAQEFFRRFPSLYPFLLSELANVTNFQVLCDEEGWPVGVDKLIDGGEKEDEEAKKILIQNEYRVHHGGMHPSLYPILLMLSQMRASMTDSSTNTATNLAPSLSPPSVAPNSSLSSSTSLSSTHLNPLPLLHGRPTLETATTNTSDQMQREANLSLFVPLVIHCCRERVHKAREMASKALVSVVPLQDVPIITSNILLSLLVSIPSHSSLHSNSSISTLVPSPRFSLPSCPTTNEIQGFLLLAYGLFQNLNRHRGSLSGGALFFSAITLQARTLLLPIIADLIVALASIHVPPLQMLLLRLIRSVKEFLGGDELDEMKKQRGNVLTVSKALLAGQCRICLANISAKWIKGPSKEGKESEEGKNVCEFLLPGQPILWKEAILEMLKLSISSRDDDMENGNDNPYSPFSLGFVLSLLTHPVSEVREGVLQGCKEALATNSLSTSSTAALLLSHNLIEELFNAMSVEKEPPILSLGMFVLCELSHATSITNSTNTSASAIDIPSHAWKTLMYIASPSSHKLPLSQTPFISITPTTSAASAVELLGWMVGKLLKGDDNPKMMEMLHEWVGVLEAAVDDDQPADIREASSKSILASNFLTFFSLMAVPKSTTLLASSPSSRHQNLAALACRVWVCAIRLLQDDDEDARDEINKAVVDTLTASNSVSSSNAFSKAFAITTVPGYTLESIGDQVAKAITLSVSSSSSSSVSFVGVDVFWSELQRLSGNAADVLLLVSADKQTLAERIFEKELANLYIEGGKAIKVFVDALHLGLLDSPFAVIEEVKMRALSMALDAAKLLTKALTNLTWLGGITLQQELFTFVHSAFYAAVTLSSLPSGGGKENQRLSKELSEACMKLMNPGNCEGFVEQERSRIHPSISSLLKALV